jgi:membrane protease YdiL (CAAX protease family)
MTILDWKVGLPVAIALSLIILSGAAFYAGVPLQWSFDLRRAAVNCFSNLYEEILCRGLLLQLIARYWGRIPAMAWTSVLFGLMHGINEKALFLALTTWIFAWAVLRTESLWSAWIIHQGSDSLVDPFVN